ncbi:MAG: hypothetical protein IJ309_02380 [Clostridia bacterium]|nr:hypothetical protein [Clostridia bacterium]
MVIISKKWHRVHFFQNEKKNKNKFGGLEPEHPVLVFRQSGQWYKVIPFTKHPTTDGKQNVPLIHNVDPENKSFKSYAVPYRAPRKVNDFQAPKKKYRIHKDDLPVIKALIGKANKK